LENGVDRIMTVPVAILLGIALFAGAWLYGKWRTLRRAEFIRTFRWPRGLLERLEKHHAGFERKDSALGSRGLRQFFLAYLMSGKRHVSMPSQVADDLWHEFILYTRDYDAFCRRAFGGCTTRRPSSSASIAGATRACAASGGIAANTRTSIRSARHACRCCLRSTASSRSPTGSSISPTAKRCARTAAATRIAAAISRIRRLTAARTGSATPVATQAVMAAATAVATGAAVAVAEIEDAARTASPA